MERNATSRCWRTLRLPAKTQFELDHPAPAGERHEQIKRIVCSLTALGFSTAEIFSTVRSRYAADVEDREIYDLIFWASTKRFQSGEVSRRLANPRAVAARVVRHIAPPIQCVDKDTAERNAKEWLDGFEAGPEDFFDRSPWRPPDEWQDDALMLFAGMYHAGEYINVVTVQRDGRPFGLGLAKPREDWMADAKARTLISREAGAWIRMNPTDGNGISDSNITAFRFALIENDKLSLGLQLALFAKLPLPINALIASGGKSIHAWIRVDAPSAEEYRRRLKEDIFPVLAPFGFDQANTNPSRLARLPGVTRKLKPSSGTGEQRLIFCAPDAYEFRPIL